MHHKYETDSIIIERVPLGEANASLVLLTPELGLLRVRVQGIRTSGAKLAGALATLAQSSVTLVRGAEGWRLVGAVLLESWAPRLSYDARKRAARVMGFLLRLVVGEEQERNVYPIMTGYLQALASLPSHHHDAAEVVAMSRLLSSLGLLQGEAAADLSCYDEPLLCEVAQRRAEHIARINTGISASGL